jgi:HTH-type transcriptional regulator, competence development regulator
MIIGKKLRELREQKGLLLRQVAASLEVDTAYISKMERGEKSIKREFIVKLAKIYDAKIDDLITIWLADQMFDIIKDEKQGLNALKQVEILIDKDNKKKK